MEEYRWVRLKPTDGKNHFRQRHCEDGFIYEQQYWYKVPLTVAEKLGQHLQVEPPVPAYYDAGYGDLAGTLIENTNDFVPRYVFDVVDDEGKVQLEQEEERQAARFKRPARRAKFEFDLTGGIPKSDSLYPASSLPAATPESSAPVMSSAPSKRKK